MALKSTLKTMLQTEFDQKSKVMTYSVEDMHYGIVAKAQLRGVALYYEGLTMHKCLSDILNKAAHFCEDKDGAPSQYLGVSKKGNPDIFVSVSVPKEIGQSLSAEKMKPYLWNAADTISAIVVPSAT